MVPNQLPDIIVLLYAGSGKIRPALIHLLSKTRNSLLLKMELNIISSV